MDIGRPWYIPIFLVGQICEQEDEVVSDSREPTNLSMQYAVHQMRRLISLVLVSRTLRETFRCIPFCMATLIAKFK